MTRVRLGAILLVALAQSACRPPATEPSPESSPSAGTVAAFVTDQALADADSLVVRDVEPGVRYVYAWRSEGPWGIHVLEVDAAVCRPEWQVRKAAGVASRATTSALGAGDLAAVNGDFFQLPLGTPVNAFVTGGVPWIGPSSWPAWIETETGPTIGVATFQGVAEAGGDSLPLASLNRAPVASSSYHPDPDGATLFTARVGRAVLGSEPATLVWMAGIIGDEAQGAGQIVRIEPLAAAQDTLARDVEVLSGSVLLVLRGEAAAWAARRHPDERVRWSTVVEAPSGARAIDAVGGFPILVQEGAAVQHGTEVRPSFGEVRHPRTAVGWTADRRRSFLVVVDGRQESYSGMSLPELTALMRELGAAEALNLDGGGSSALVVRGRVVSHPSDARGERAVGDALALAGCGVAAQNR